MKFAKIEDIKVGAQVICIYDDPHYCGLRGYISKFDGERYWVTSNAGHLIGENGWIYPDSWAVINTTFQRQSSISTCKRCNAVNEYAQSNQTDGTYLCFECR